MKFHEMESKSLSLSDLTVPYYHVSHGEVEEQMSARLTDIFRLKSPRR